MRVSRIVLLIMVLVALTLGSVSCDLFSGGGSSGGNTGGGGSAPAVPTGLSVGYPTPISLSVSWNASSGSTSYQLYQDTSSSGSFATKVYDGSGTSFVDFTVSPGSTYYYKVRATNSSASSGLSGASNGVEAFGTINWQPLGGECVFVTNDPANYGLATWDTISGSVLTLSGTLDSTVTKWSGSTVGDIGIIFDYWVDTYSQPNFWMFNVDYTSPTGYYAVYRHIGGASPGWSQIQAYTTNASIVTSGGQSNGLKVTYSYVNPTYYLKFYINGVLVYTWSTSGAAPLVGGLTGFLAEVQTTSNAENFPTVPVLDTYVQTLPITFSGNMVAGPSGARASIQAMPPSKSGTIAPQPNRFPTPR